MTVAQPGEEAPYLERTAYQRCLGKSADALLVRHVEAYVAKNPVNSNEPMVRIVVRTLSDLCRAEIEKPNRPGRMIGVMLRTIVSRSVVLTTAEVDDRELTAGTSAFFETQRLRTSQD